MVCSSALIVHHYIDISPSQPSITWLNSSVPRDVVTYQFDGLCDITLTESPTNNLTLNVTQNATHFTVEMNKNSMTVPGVHNVTISSNRSGRSFKGVTREVFVGEEIRDLQV